MAINKEKLQILINEMNYTILSPNKLRILLPEKNWTEIHTFFLSHCCDGKFIPHQ